MNLKNYYQNIIIYDLLTKLNFKNIFEINKIEKICLNIGFKNANIEKKKMLLISALLKLITNQNPLVTSSKKNNLFLKIKKGSIIGCKVTLRKNNMYIFLENFLFFVFPFIKKELFLNNKRKHIFDFQIQNILHFFELQTEFLKFKEIPPIDISIHTNSKQNQELNLLLNSFYIFK